jgi:hypothetical protein
MRPSPSPAVWKVALALAAYTLLATMPVCKLLGPTLGPGAWVAGAVVSAAAGEVFARRWHPVWQ